MGTGRPKRLSRYAVISALFILLGSVSVYGEALAQTEERADTSAVPGEPADQSNNPPVSNVEAPTEGALRRVQSPFEETPPEDVPEEELTENDLCDADYSEPHWQEDTQEFFRTVSCHTFRWSDGLFGDSIDYPEEAVRGLATVGGSWDEYEGFDSRLRFKVRAPLPNLNNRWSLILDRGAEDAYISDTETQNKTFYNPGLVNRQEEDSLLLGLGGRPRDGRKGWDWSVGARLRRSPVPYVRARWYYYRAYSQDTDLRFRQTFFWRSDDGFGATARADLTHALNPKDVLRLESVVTGSEETEGTEWYVGHTWYHLINSNKAFSLLAFANGETNAAVSMRNAGLNFIWRQNLTRDWIWISYGPSITWPRFEPEDERELTLGFGVWVEMEFGAWRF